MTLLPTSIRWVSCNRFRCPSDTFRCSAPWPAGAMDCTRPTISGCGTPTAVILPSWSCQTSTSISAMRRSLRDGVELNQANLDERLRPHGRIVNEDRPRDSAIDMAVRLTFDELCLHGHGNRGDV